MANNPLGSEGVVEYHGLNSVALNKGEANLFLVARSRYAVGSDEEPFVVFSDTIENAGGDALKKYIQDHPEYGEVLESEIRKNPNSGNQLRIYIYMPNDGALRGFYEKWARIVSREVERRRKLGRDTTFITVDQLMYPLVDRVRNPVKQEEHVELKATGLILMMLGAFSGGWCIGLLINVIMN